jgi:hypothetical protein
MVGGKGGTRVFVTFGVDDSFFLVLFSLFFSVACRGLVSDSEYKGCGT